MSKEKAKKLIIRNFIKYCPNCNQHIDNNRIIKYCFNCGQKLEWEKENE